MAKLQKGDPPLEQRDPPAPKRGSGGKWLPYLEPLIRSGNRNVWWMVMEFDRPEQAQDARNNLNARKVTIPEPTHDWGFAARGCELFAIYRGITKPKIVKKTIRRHDPNGPRSVR